MDVVVIDGKQRYFKKALEYETKKIKKYWRLVNYPLEAFAVCIEIKIRVSGNMKRIKKDIKKLYTIGETKKEKGCFVYLVVVDRKASIKSINDIQKYCDNNRVTLKKAIPSKQTS